ncbi:caspase, EACC1-associated type [Geodermatophilus obscurus]|nr:caspase family protein [Geodermatophilus obscurus]
MPLESGRRAALIVATGHYADPELQQLRAPVADAEQFAAVLARPDIAAFEVRTVIDAPARVIARELQQFLAGRGRNDLLLVYFSCHGLKDVDGSLYFAGTDTEMDFLASTGVSAAFVNERVDACRSNRIILLLDCCYSGAFTKSATKGDLSVGVQERLQGQGRVVMTASNAMEYAFEGHHLSMEAPAPSLFTGTIVRGLSTGEADRDCDGRVSVDELYDYVYDNVRRETSNQTPGLFASLSGTLYLARRPDGPVDLEPTAPALPPPVVVPYRGTGPRRRQRPWMHWLRRRRRPAIAAACALLLAAVTVTVALVWPPATSSWTRIADMPQPVEAAAVTSYRDRLFVIGGVNPAPGRGPLSTVQVYDPATASWSIGPALPVALNHAAAVTTRDSVYVLGGIAADGSTDTVYRLDSPDGQWQVDQPLPEARGAGAAAFDGERIVFAGGVDRAGLARAEVWALTPDGRWTPAGELEPAREKLTAATDGYGGVWFMGGRDIRGAPGEATYGSVDIVTRTGVQHLGRTLPALSAPGGAQVPGQGMCVVGGQEPDGQFNAGVHCVEGTTEPRPPDLPRPRAGLGVAVLRGEVYAVGGYYAGTNGTALAQVYRPPTG